MANILELIIKTIKAGTGFPDTEKEASRLKGALDGINKVLAVGGFAIGAKEVFDFGRAAVEANRAQQDAINTLAAASEGIADYNEALRIAQQETQGMASKTELASSLGVIFGAGLAKNAEQAAQLASAGTVLSNVFASAGASQDLYVRLLSSGSIQLFNNFGITQQMVAEQQKLIESTTNLTGEEARLAAVKQALIANAEKYKTALSDDTIAAAQFNAAMSDMQAALGALILPQVTQTMENFGSVIREATSAAEELPSPVQELIQGFINIASPITTVNNLIETYQGLTEEAADSTVTYVSSLRAMDLTGAISQVNQLNQALSEQSALQAGAFGGQQDTFSQGLNIERIQAAGAARIKSQEDAAAADEEAQRVAERSAQAISRSFVQAADTMADRLTSAIESEITPTLQEVWSPGEDEQRADEWARRLATVATSGLSSEWITQLQQRFGGQSFFQPVMDAIAAGDQTGAMEAAKQVLTNNIAQLWDVELIKQRVREKLAAQDARAQLIAEVQKALGAEGIAQTTSVVAQAAGDVDLATQSAGTSVATMATTTEAAGTQIKTAFDAALPPVNILIARLQLMVGIIERIGVVSQASAGAIAGLNPPNLPTDAQRRMNGTAGL